MAKFNEQTLTNWTYPASQSEETKMLHAERLVKEALKASAKIQSISIEVFGQGSYANDTNVRLNSDIDINAMYTEGFYFDLPNGMSREDFGLNNPISYSFDEYKNDIEQALVDYFGRQSVKRNNKCITVLANSVRVETDVVPTWKYKRYNKNKTSTEGVYFVSDSGEKIDSYPKQHIKNGRLKNSNTHKRFKRLTRVLKKIRYKMIDDGISVSPSISSFLIEGLLWNVPDDVYNNNSTWSLRLKEACRYLYYKTKNMDDCKNWGEVSELLYLFYSGRKWDFLDVNQFILSVWSYMEFED